MQRTQIKYSKKSLAFAKLNLFLAVNGKRDDGYHEIETVMLAVGLCDELYFENARGGEVELVAEGQGLPPVEENLVVKATRLLQRRFETRGGVRIRLKKNIPPGSGLGGGSSDAATALKEGSRLWGLKIGGEELQRIAAELGSDVPFFIRSGASVCGGRGEQVRPIHSGGKMYFVIAIPPVEVSTSMVYSRVDSLTKESELGNIDRVISSIEQNDSSMLGASLFNELSEPASAVCPELRVFGGKLKEAFQASGCLGYSLSGSGSAWFGVYPDRISAARAASYVAENEGVSAYAVQSV